MEVPTRVTEPGTPLYQISAERVNQRLSPSKDALDRPSRDSVHEKVAVFNTLAMQSRHLERKTNDAALQRAMLGREEAESEMRRWKQEAENARRAADELEHRNRKVSERLESQMVSCNFRERAP